MNMDALRLTALSSAIIIACFLGFASCYHHHHHTGINIGDDAEGCKRAMKRAAAIDGATIILDSPSAIHGRWVSEGCETRPGPEFLLRSYTFHANNTFKLVQYYYTEESCSTPGYTIVARGKLLPHDGYSLKTVAVIPNSFNVAHHLSAKINNTCPGLARKRWKPYKEHYILNLSDEFFSNYRSNRSSDDMYRSSKKHHRSHYIEKFNCLRALTLVFHELHHYKIQIRPGLNGNYKTTHLRQELLLGDIHSNLNSRADYKPTSFQVPLLRIDSSIADALGIDSASLLKSDSLLNIDTGNFEEKEHRVYQKSYIGHFDVGTVGDLDSILSSKNSHEVKPEQDSKNNEEIFSHCHVCSAIASANEKSPPYLMTKVTLPLLLSGEWVSLQCEQRPMHLYLTRHFRFYTGDLTWIVEYKFYYDSVCTGASFSVTAAGHYKIGKTGQYVSGGTEADFHIERASITVFDQRMIENLEQDTDCGSGDWQLGIPREMSSTNGCPTLGLVVPSIEYELLKLEVDFYGFSLLYMGQADTEGKRRGIKDRPTAYQLPLVQCKNLPPYSENLREILSSPLYGDGVYSNYDRRILAMEKDSLYSSGNVKYVNILLTISVMLYALIR